MQYVKVNSNNEIIEYPANPALDHPHISFPSDWSGGDIEGNVYVTVTLTDIPSANLGWSVSEGTPSYSNGQFVQTWNSNLKSKEQLKADVAAYRYEQEIAGICISNTNFFTDRESQTKYIANCLS